MAVAERRRRHGDGLPPGLTEPGGGEELQPRAFYPFRHWRTACGALNLCLIPGVWYSQNFTETSGVEGIEAFGQGLGDGQCLTPIQLMLQTH